jgi:putative transferase (TIGR04331 family)
MIKHKKYLITTAIEETWKFDQPVIFLGEWCKLYDRRHLWENMDAIVAKPYGLDKIVKDTDFNKKRSLENFFFFTFFELLNEHHKTQYSERFWKILLGHWFRKTLGLLINRINTISKCLESYNISGCTFYENKDIFLASLDETSFETKCSDDIWNNFLYQRIINFFEVDFPIEILKYKSSNLNKNINFSQYNETIKSKIFQKILKIYSHISSKLKKKNDAFIINSYLNLDKEIKLQLALKQWPQIWAYNRDKFSLSNSYKDYDKSIREKLKNKFIYRSANKLEEIITSLLFELLPICYLEGFRNLEKLANQQPWPNDPKFIFTSNNYEADEIFKFWCATKVEKGVKYFVGQHGNRYGISRNFSEQIEETTSDKFITWGYKGKLPQHIPAFVLKTAGDKKKKINFEAGLLLVQQHLPHRYETWDTDAEFVKYFDDQKKFVKMLSTNPKKKLVIRLHHAHNLFRWNEMKRWIDFDPLINIDNGLVNIKKLISKNKLIVHSYNSTGTLETLSQNIPTLIFWQNELDIIEKNAMPHFQLLINAGILHLSPKSAANKVNEIWDKVENWWMQKQVQDARKEFCDIYARTCNNPVSNLKKILLS